MSDGWPKTILDLLRGKNGTTGDFKYTLLSIHILSVVLIKTSNTTTLEFY